MTSPDPAPGTPSGQAPRAAPLLTAAGLAVGPAVALGFGRFAYALLLPPMRSSLHWSYTQAGAMNTANGLGYLLGALLAPAVMRRSGARAAFLFSLLGTALTLGFTALSGDLRWLIVMRFLTGLGGAVTFTSGGLLVAQVASDAPARQAGAVLGLFYAGAGLGVFLTGLGLPPLLTLGHWSSGWLALGACRCWGWVWPGPPPGTPRRRCRAALPFTSRRSVPC
ncbi:YbfB/YjiJ family MFS transporter [Deinococcus alpinitundrae]|uniref:YbfB/YjiJ family MFS transporter n=1 Tax=Deinococcus alpinitundrae TaxID=468913 RepID=UPI00137B43BE|nr:YbfB/YjiJ family MFS transporter [Deinococcus alpinitundrae]